MTTWMKFGIIYKHIWYTADLSNKLGINGRIKTGKSQEQGTCKTTNSNTAREDDLTVLNVPKIPPLPSTKTDDD